MGILSLRKRREYFMTSCVICLLARWVLRIRRSGLILVCIGLMELMVRRRVIGMLLMMAGNWFYRVLLMSARNRMLALSNR